jgi:hypothetical protein
MASFEKPILVVTSDEDYVTIEAKQPFVDQMPTAHMVVIENAHQQFRWNARSNSTRY